MFTLSQVVIWLNAKIIMSIHQVILSKATSSHEAMVQDQKVISTLKYRNMHSDKPDLPSVTLLA